MLDVHCEAKCGLCLHRYTQKQVRAKMVLRCTVLTGPRFLRDIQIYEVAQFAPVANILRCLGDNSS